MRSTRWLGWRWRRLWRSLEAPRNPRAWQDLGASLVHSLLYGLINAFLAVPALYGYAAVIFKATSFQGYSAHLAKAVVLSSAVHQLVFCVRSNLPFAIGQVQDAGLIFLSKMAFDIAVKVETLGGSDHDATTTALFGLSVSTATLGLVLVGLGRARLTSIVSFLPMPVLGGYLAYIGFFCCEAGIGLCINETLTGPMTWHVIWDKPWNLVLALPGVVGGAILCQVARLEKGDVLLPAAMVALPVLFYVVIAVAPDYSFSDAVDDGWIKVPDVHPASMWDLARLYQVGRIEWRALPQIVPQWCSMVVVVAFSSCLDIAAIEIDLGEPLDMDEELKTVGVSNVIAGCCGGFTGSYIFSQTIFSCRANVRSRLVGLIVALAEVAVVVAKVDIVAILPLFFFSATLTFVGIDLLREWLWEVRFKFAQPRELAALYATFVAIFLTTLNTGLLIGCAAASLEFMSTVVTNSVAPRRILRSSFETRPVADARKLERLRHRLVVLEISGFVWWGTATSLLASIRKALPAAPNNNTNNNKNEQDQPRLPSFRSSDGEDEDDDTSTRGPATDLLLSPNFLHRRRANKSNPATPKTDTHRASLRQAALTEVSSLLLDDAAHHHHQQRPPRKEAVADEAGRAGEEDDLKSWVVVLDFRRVSAVDASAVRSCFAPLAREAERRNFGVAFAAVAEDQFRLFKVHGVIPEVGGPEDCVQVLDTVDNAVRWAEARQLTARERGGGLVQTFSLPPAGQMIKGGGLLPGSAARGGTSGSSLLNTKSAVFQRTPVVPPPAAWQNATSRVPSMMMMMPPLSSAETGQHYASDSELKPSSSRRPAPTTTAAPPTSRASRRRRSASRDVPFSSSHVSSRVEALAVPLFIGGGGAAAVAPKATHRPAPGSSAAAQLATRRRRASYSNDSSTIDNALLPPMTMTTTTTTPLSPQEQSRSSSSSTGPPFFDPSTERVLSSSLDDAALRNPLELNLTRRKPLPTSPAFIHKLKHAYAPFGGDHGLDPIQLSLGAARYVARLMGCRDDDHVIAELRRSLSQFSIPMPMTVYDLGEPAAEFYCVLTGEVNVEYPYLDVSGAAHHEDLHDCEVIRPGAWFGYVDYSLGRPRTAMADVPKATTLLVVTAASLQDLAQHAPVVAVQLQSLVLRFASQELANS